MQDLKNNNPVPLWGGIECTINRVQDKFIDQLEQAGYYNNDYLPQVAELGIKTLRFPLLWEKHQPEKDQAICFKWAASQLEQMQKAGIEPIAGLVHHGSGPAYTNLLQPDFPELLASYASKVAAAFPWIKYYTPVNEPLTTARFSGLYGYWYPHKNNDVSFTRMLLNQLKGVVLSMAEIRKINPEAVLVQTEDLSKTYSTPLLQYQADFENHRRWLTYDILCGKFNTEHPLWNYFKRLGIEEPLLQFFIDNPCPPGIIGINYYVTSERYLDENISSYPVHTHGGNGIHQYADVEAIRVNFSEPHGPELLIKENWERYKIPVAITEVHLHCSREEQLRWFRYMYNVAVKSQSNGVDIRGITSWALLGSYGWSRLLTDDFMEYESGAFDISAGYARITALGRYIKTMAGNQRHYDHLLDQPGWWQTNDRFLIQDEKQEPLPVPKKKPLLILGKSGTLGKAFSIICKQRNIPFILLGRQDIDICTGNIGKVLEKYKPWAVINATGYVDVEKAEINSRDCELVNSIGALNLAMACDSLKIKLVYFSSDLVFDGLKTSPYVETDQPNPLNVYGNSKMVAERFITSLHPSALIIRTSAFFGPWDRYNFLTVSLSRLLCDETVYAAVDKIVSPTYVPHLVNACLDLLIDGEKGIWHLANKGQVSWYEFAVKAAAHYHIGELNIKPSMESDVGIRRPDFSVLASNKYGLMPSLDQALEEYYCHKNGSVYIS